MTDKADAIEAIVPGCATDAALEAFVASCNTGPDRLFFTGSWGRPLLARVRASLPESLGQEDALLLRNVLDKRIGLADVAEYLEARPRLLYQTWEQWKVLRDLQPMSGVDLKAPLPVAGKGCGSCPPYHAAVSGLLRGVPETFARVFGSAAEAVAAASRHARACPTCGCPGHELLWGFSEWDEDRRRCGPSATRRCGWTSVCHHCRHVVEVRYVYPKPSLGWYASAVHQRPESLAGHGL